MRALTFALAGAALCAAVVATAPAPSLAGEQFIPALVYRSGPYAPNGIPFADGFVDYLELLNQRDGGINGNKIAYEECDTGYNTDRGVECYERLKNKNGMSAPAIVPLSTGITYALIERGSKDKIPIFSSGYGRSDASYGPVFPYLFTAPATYWSAADNMITYIAQQSGGFDKLKGKKIAYVYHDSAFGKEPLAMFEVLKNKYGFEFYPFPVAAPGLEQKAIWLRIGRQLKPDWALMWGWGVMNPTAIKEAAAVNFPRERFIGVWWSGSEQDVAPAPDVAKGYKALNFHAPGKDFQVHRDIEKFLYAKGANKGSAQHVGTVLYNRGLMNAVFVTEAIRDAMVKNNNQPVNGEQVAAAFAGLDMSPQRLAGLGLEGFMPPVRLSCLDHEGAGPARIQQWDGTKWVFVSDWLAPNTELIRPLYKEGALKYAAEKNITPITCP